MLAIWEDLAPVLAIAVVIGVPVIGWVITDIAKNWRKVRVSEQLAALKQSMIERGMTAEEIERVLDAGAPATDRPVKAT
jgi:hypothetical protein